MKATHTILIKTLNALALSVSALITFLLGAIMKISLTVPALYAGYAVAFVVAILFFIWTSKHLYRFEQSLKHGRDR